MPFPPCDGGRGAVRLPLVVLATLCWTPGLMAQETNTLAPVEVSDQAPAEDDTYIGNVTLRADRALDYGRVMAVMGELNRAGLNRISLVTNGGQERAPVNSGSGTGE